MNQVTITIDGHKIRTSEGSSLLWTALENGIYLPHLCSMKDDVRPDASCRLCFVEIEGIDSPVTACTETVTDGMVVSTGGRKSLEIITAGFRLLMASHRTECGLCFANGKCELQDIAAWLKVKLSDDRLPVILKDSQSDGSGSGLVYDADKCVLCGRCVRVSRTRTNVTSGFTGKGFNRKITLYPGNNESSSTEQIVSVCPSGALSLR